MDAAICLHNVTKSYKDFTLDHITLDIPKGSIVGLVGENGAGKTTLLKCILQLATPEEGQIYIDDKPLSQLSGDWKNNVGVILSGIDFAGSMTGAEFGKTMEKIYENWEMDTYQAYLKDFKIDASKKIKEYSKGMKMKLCLALALSHQAKILIFDEPTSGLDPVVRDDILDLLLDFIQDESHTVLISSHIISDLEKVADYIAFLHEGRLQLFMNKDEMLDKHGVIHCSAVEYDQIPEDYVKGIRKGQFCYEVLVSDRHKIQRELPGLTVDSASIEEIILFLVKGGEK